MDTITIISLILGVLGLVATLAGTILAYTTFINPKVRVDKYLKKPKNWEQIELGLTESNSLWRYKKHPEFSIEQQNDSREWDFGVNENWMKYPLPDPSKTTYLLHIKAGSIVVYSEQFITLDGGRYFVPLPRVDYSDEKKDNKYFYTGLQVRIAKIVGKFYRMKSIDEFVEHQDIEVRKY